MVPRASILVQMMFYKDWRSTFPEVELRCEQNRLCFTEHASSLTFKVFLSVAGGKNSLSAFYSCKVSCSLCSRYWQRWPHRLWEMLGCCFLPWNDYLSCRNWIGCQEFLLKRLPADTAFELMLNWDKHKEAKHLNFNMQWSRRLYFELARGLIAASSQEKSWRKNICKMGSGLLWEGVLSFLSPNKTWTLLLCSLAARQQSPVSGCQVLRVQFALGNDNE